MLRLFRRNPQRAAADALYDRIVARARDPAFFTACGVPDSLDGRFELIALHAFLVLHRLRVAGERTRALGQAVFDAMFEDFDRALRELGTGDLSVGREVKRMAQAFYGRAAAYEAGLAAGGPTLEAALRRNLFGTAAPSAAALAAVAGYLGQAVAALRALPLEALEAGRAEFGALPELAAAEPVA
jgi:cytochrome b pre-mRNA-processing protein 3